MDGCLERARDLSHGLKYNNFGVHGAGSANAADALAAVRRFVFEDESVQPQELLAALEANFEGYEPLRRKLAEDGPKVGNNDAAADSLMTQLFEWFADACEAIQDNGRGGRVRPGTGSAMYYVWLARGKEGMREPAVGATAEGRKKGEFLSANLAPRTMHRSEDRSASYNPSRRFRTAESSMAGLSPWNSPGASSATPRRSAKSRCWFGPLRSSGANNSSSTQ